MIPNQDFSIDFKRYKLIYLYYFLLHLVCLSWTNIAEIEPPLLARLVITAGVFIPLIKHFWMAPAVIILFAGLRFNSVAPFGYVPTSWHIYECLILFIATVHVSIYKNNKIFKFNKNQIFLFFFLFLVDLINLQPFTPIFLFSLMLFILYNSIQNKKAFNLAVLSFIILTITLSIYYFVFAKEFVVAYHGSHEERAVWVDPNYFGIVLGCGTILSSAYIYRTINVKINAIYKCIFITCIILSIMVIALQASRGTMLAVVIAISIQLLFSKTKFYIKLFLIAFTFIGVVYLFQSDYFNLLLERIEEDDGSGSGRSRIWAKKIGDWTTDFSNLLGGGFQASLNKFTPIKKDCHNEYISILLNYGIMGAFILLVSIYKLCRIVKNRIFIWSVVTYILIAFMTISPFSCTTGWIACPFLILLLYKFIALDKLESCFL